VVAVGQASPSIVLAASLHPQRRYSGSTYVIGFDGSTVFARNNNTGKIEYSSTDATTVIQNAINAFGTTGGTIFLTTGTYEVGQIVVAKSGVTIEASPGAVLSAIHDGVTKRLFYSTIAGDPVYGQKTGPIASAPVVLVDSAQDVILRNIVIDGNPPSGTGYYRDGIFVWDSSRILIEGCEIKNVEGNGIRVRSSGTYDLGDPENSHLKSSNITITNCYVHNTITHTTAPSTANWVFGWGYEIEYSDQVTVSSSVASNCQESSFRLQYSRHVLFDSNTADLIDRGGEPHTGESFDIYRSDHIGIKNNRILEPLGIYVYEFVRNLVAEGNQLSGCAGDCAHSLGVRLCGLEGSRSFPIENIQFKNNVIANGILLSNYYLKNLSFVGNTFYYLQTTTPGGPTTFDEISFTNNNFLAAGDNPPAALVVIPMSFVGNRFQNRIYVQGTTGQVVVQDNDFSSDGVSYATGIYIKDSVQYIQIEGNHFHDLTYEGIVAYGSNGVFKITNNTFDNNGYKMARNQIDLGSGSASSVILNNNTFRNTVGQYAAWLGGNPSDISGNVSDKPISQ